MRDPAERNRKLQELHGIIVKQRQEIASLERLLGRKATLVRMMVHDLKGPLSGIMANLDLLGKNRLKPQEHECVETALMGCQDLFHMIQNLLEIGKMEQGQIELNLSIVDPEELFREVVKKMKTLSEQKGVRLLIDCRSAVRALPVDAHLLERIIYNLVLNALTYSSPEGEVILSTTDGMEKEKIRLAVSDSGIGIPPEFQDTIFDVYAQVDSRQGIRNGGVKTPGSVGLGLAFCRLAAEQHGGRIWVQSVPGQGSTFIVELPTDLMPFGSGLM
ncbi:MAG: HAMP domain-containing histidine kinase [Proteobacteria bacterium]|nr:HAMP domain-containing histidine kinase [Pseudomonadota bacterium]